MITYTLYAKRIPIGDKYPIFLSPKRESLSICNARHVIMFKNLFRTIYGSLYEWNFPRKKKKKPNHIRVSVVL